MRRLKKLAAWSGLAIVLGVVVLFALRDYVVRAVILAVARRQYGGNVVLGGWWLDGTSAGVTGVALGETDRPDGPSWIAVDRISTDVSLPGLLRGRFLPTKVEVAHPRLSLRFDAKGQLATPLPFRSAGGGDGSGAATATLPAVTIKQAEVTVAQAGRPPLTIHQADATLTPEAGREVIRALTDDPVWGHVRVAGHFDPDFRKGTVTIDSSPGFVADPAEVKKIPFVPTEVWDNVEARGPVDASVKLDVDLRADPPIHVLTKLHLKGATAKLAPLQVESTETTGDITIDDAKVAVEHFRGKAVSGTIRAAGVLDFAQDPPDFDVDLRLRGIDVTKAPAAWQLGELGATGTLTGKVDLRMRLDPTNIDLTGTTGRAVIEDGSVQGIPIKSLTVNLKAEGGDLQFETQPSNQPVDKTALEAAPAIPNPHPRPVVAGAKGHPGPRGGPRPEPTKEAPTADQLFEPALAALPLARVLFGDDGPLGLGLFLASEIVERRTSRTTTPPGSRLRLPKTITTRLELEDVDLKTLLAKVERFGFKPNFPIAGRLSVKATATIPIGTLTDLKAYTVHGDASLSRASIDHVDLGELAAHLDVEDGVVNLSDFRGVLVDRPADDGSGLAQASPVPPRTGDLPDGGFRANVRAQVAPKGLVTAKIEGRRLPLGELFAPVLPSPTPLSGDLSIRGEASVDLAALADPRAYKLDGNFESRRIAYRGALLDRVAAKFAVKEGRATLAELSALLAGRPLVVHGGVSLAPPYAFSGDGKVEGWEVGALVGFVPAIPKEPKLAGRLDANADVSGTLFPFSVRTAGGARLAAIRVGPVESRYVVFGWQTDGGVVVLSGLDAAVFGGKITGDARVPTRAGGQPLVLNLAVKGIDTAAISDALPTKAVAISGVADGRVKLAMPLDASTVDADADLHAPDLAFRPQGRYGEGIKVESLRIVARAHEKVVKYRATATSLGAKLLFDGTMPLDADPLKGVADAEAKVVGFRFGDAWRGLGMSGGIAELDGEGALVANLRGTVEPPQLWSRGLFELRGLRYGTRLPIGEVRGQVTLTPTSWKLENVEGSLFGGVTGGAAQGSIRLGKGLGPSSFDVKVDRASVPKLLAGVPSLAHGSSGYGTLRASGRLDESLHLDAEVDIPQAKILNMTLTDVRVPADINISPASGVGMAHARRWTARLAGGLIEGKAWARLGTDRSFHSDVRLAGVDLEVLSRLGAISSKASSGKLSGTLTLDGPNPEDVARAHGRFNFDLDDATLVSLPIFRELDRFMGAARGGGLFEDGDIAGNIGNETIYIEQMTLNGRVIQVHALGSVTFKGGLNLEVLVNTNQLIPQSGMALLNVIPGLGEAIGRSEQVVLRLGAFLSSRLLKFRVTGTVQNPRVNLDPNVDVGNSAVGFFSNVLKVPGD